MNLKKISAIALVSASILAGASAIEAKPSWNAYSTSLTIYEDCSDEVIAQVKEKFEGLKNSNYYKATLSLNSVSVEQALKALKAFPEVGGISFSKVNFTNLDFVKDLPNLEKINFSGDYKFKEPLDLSALTGNTKLEEVYFTSTILKDLAPIATCKNIKKFKAYMCEIQSNTISPLKELTNLEDVNLYGTNIDDFGILAPCTKLKRIDVYATKPNKESTLDYNRLSEIKSLEYIHAGLTDKMTSVAFLKDLPKFKKIEFLGEDITDLETLENCKTIESIRFWSHSRPIDAAKVGKAQSLKKLTLSSISALNNVEGLGNLVNMEDLEINEIKNYNAPNAPLDTSFLANMPKLKKLAFTKVQINDLSKTGASLKTLSFYQLNKNDDKPFDLTKIVAPELETLEISEAKLSNVASVVKNFPKIQSLKLQKCEGIDNYDFLKELPEKTYVILSKGAITEDQVKELKDTKNIRVNLW